MPVSSSCSRGASLPTSLPVDVTQAFTDLLGDTQGPLKGALRTARLIEEQFLTDGWPIGRRYGGEADLARRYDAGEAMIREAIRILEARGTARMRAGRNASLEVTAPSLAQLCDGLISYCTLIGVTQAQIVVARTQVDRAAARIAAERAAAAAIAPAAEPGLGETDAGNWRRWLLAAARNPAIAFYSSCLDDLVDLNSLHSPEGAAALPSEACSGSLDEAAARLREAVVDGDAEGAAEWAGTCSHRSAAWQGASAHQRPCSSAAGHPPRHGKRAQQIVSDLLRSLGPGQWRDGVLLGNEQELSARYDVDRRSLRQAIRILEASQVAVTVPGRGRGLIACTPKPASFSRLICCHFAATNVTRFHVFQAFEWLSIETLMFAAKHADPARVADVATEAEIARRSFEVVPRQQAELEEKHFALADNPVLELLLRSARAYNSLGGIGRSAPKPDEISGMAKCINEVTEALLARDAAAAADAQARKCAIVRRQLEVIGTS